MYPPLLRGTFSLLFFYSLISLNSSQLLRLKSREQNDKKSDINKYCALAKNILCRAFHVICDLWISRKNIFKALSKIHQSHFFITSSVTTGGL